MKISSWDIINQYILIQKQDRQTYLKSQHYSNLMHHFQELIREIGISIGESIGEFHLKKWNFSTEF